MNNVERGKAKVYRTGQSESIPLRYSKIAGWQSPAFQKVETICNHSKSNANSPASYVTFPQDSSQFTTEVKDSNGALWKVVCHEGYVGFGANSLYT